MLLFTVTGLAPFGSGAWQVVFRRVYAGTPELGNLEQENPALARAFGGLSFRVPGAERLNFVHRTPTGQRVLVALIILAAIVWPFFGSRNQVDIATVVLI